MHKLFLVASVFIFSLVTACDQHENKVENEIKSSLFNLKVSEEHGKAISEIVTTLGTTNLVALGFKKPHLKSLGAGLKGVGGLQFLGYILNNKELKASLASIHKSSIKWNGFLDGLKGGLERELESKKLIEELPSFAAFSNADHEKLLTQALEHNWSEFVAILVEAGSEK